MTDHICNCVGKLSISEINEIADKLATELEREIVAACLHPESYSITYIHDTRMVISGICKLQEHLNKYTIEKRT